MLSALAIAGYRSLRDVRVALGSLNVVTGPNGSGKSSHYVCREHINSEGGVELRER